MARKGPPQTNRKQESGAGYDVCLTHPYVLKAFTPYLRPGMRLWEPCAGQRHLVNGIHIPGYDVPGLRDLGYDVVDTDIADGDQFDALFYVPEQPVDRVVTNVPFSIKYWLMKRFMELSLPFMIIVPAATLYNQEAWDIWYEFGQGVDYEEIVVTPRINFRMPVVGWEDSSAQLATSIVTWGCNLGKQRVHQRLERPDKLDLRRLDEWEMEQKIKAEQREWIAKQTARPVQIDLFGDHFQEAA